MSSGPVSQDPGRDEDPRPGPPWPDWMDDPAYLAMRAADTDPGDLDLDDPDDDPPPDVDDSELAAEAAEMIAAQGRVAAVMGRLGLTAAMAADAAAALGRRGPGMPGVRADLPGGVCQPVLGVRVRQTAGYRARVPGAGQFAEEAAGPVTGTRVLVMMSWAG